MRASGLLRSFLSLCIALGLHRTSKNPRKTSELFKVLIFPKTSHSPAFLPNMFWLVNAIYIREKKKGRKEEMLRYKSKKICTRSICVYVFSHSVVSDSATPWTRAHQAPITMEFSRQEYWSGLPFPPPGIFPTQGSNPDLPHCRWILYFWAIREAHKTYIRKTEKKKKKKNCWWKESKKT